MNPNVMTRRGEARGLLGWPQGPQSLVNENLRMRVKHDAKGRSHLDLSHRGLGYIPLQVFQFQQLDILTLSHNNLDQIPPMISYLRGIRTLHFQHNSLTTLPPTIANLRHLTELDLTQNSLASLPKGLGGLRALKVLKVGNNQMEQIPHELGNLRNLRVLDLHGNRLWYVPFSLQNLYHLLRLDLSDNLFDQIPLVVTKLTWLRALDISANRLASLPPDFDQLRELRELNLSENRFVVLGVMATKLRQLKYLSLAHNRLVSVPPQLVRLKNLRVLHLQGNCLDALPDEFPSLKYLNVAENKLSHFSVLRVKELVALDASGNHLETLPRGVFGLKNLQRMNMARNKITEVPEDIGWLRKLQSMDLSENDLHCLPAALHFMEKLTSFNVRGNHNISRFPKPPAQHGKAEVKAEEWFRPSSAIAASQMNAQDKKKKASKGKDAGHQHSNLHQHQSASMPSLLATSRKDNSSQLMTKSKGSSIWPHANSSHQDRTWLDNFLFSKHHPHHRRASWDSIAHHKSATLRSKAKSVPYPLDDRFEMGEIRASFSAESVCSSSSNQGKRYCFDGEASVVSFNSDDNAGNTGNGKEEQDSALEVSFSSDDSNQQNGNNGGTHLEGNDWLISYSKKTKTKSKKSSTTKDKKKKKKTKTPSKKSAIITSKASSNKSVVNFGVGNTDDSRTPKKTAPSTTTLGSATTSKSKPNNKYTFAESASGDQTERKVPYDNSQLGIYNYYYPSNSEIGEGGWEPRQMNILRTTGSTSRATSQYSTKERTRSKPASSVGTQWLKSDSNWTMRSHFSEPLTVQTWTQTVPEGVGMNTNTGTLTQSADAQRGSHSSFFTGIRSASSPQIMRVMMTTSDPLLDNNFELRHHPGLVRSPSPTQPSPASSSLLQPPTWDNHTNFSPVTNIDSQHSFEPGNIRDPASVQNGSTDYTLLGMCNQTQTLLHRDLLQPVIGFNGQHVGRFSNKTIKCGENGTWHYSHTRTSSTQGEGPEQEVGLEYSPGETFTTTDRGGHFVSVFCPHVQVSVPPGATDRSLHVTLQQLTISNSVLKAISDVDTYVSNIISVGPVVYLNALEKVTFKSPVTLTLPAPARVKGHKGHLVVMSVRHDNTCVPCTTAYQSSKREVTLTTWHMTGKVAVLTKAKCKYKACKSVEQLLATLNIMALTSHN